MAVDLAAKYSAFCIMDDTGQVLSEHSSAGWDEDAFVDALTSGFALTGRKPDNPEMMIIEDLPHGVPYRTVVKDVCRLQGRIYHAMNAVGARYRMRFVQPQTWRNHHHVPRGSGAAGAVPTAAALGYTAPEHLATKPKALRTKVTTDFCAAFLIARWAVDFWHTNNQSWGPPSITLPEYDTNISRLRREQKKNAG